MHNKEEGGMRQLPPVEPCEDLEICSFMIDNIVPDVMYRDWNDFVGCVYETQQMFKELIADSVEHERILQAKKRSRFECTFVICDNNPVPMFTGNCFTMISDRGSSVIKNLTKGRECAFTRLVAKNLYNQCLRLVSSYCDIIYYYICYKQDIDPETTDTRLRFDYQHLCDLMQNNVQFAFTGLMPVNMCFNSCGFVGALMTKNFYIFDSESREVMSVLQYQDFILTLTLGLHPRLGLASPLLLLNIDIFRQIIATLVLPRNMALDEFKNRELWLF